MAQVFKIPTGGNYPPLNKKVPQWWNTALPPSDPNVIGSGDDSYVPQYDITETNKEIRFRDPRWMGAFKKSFGTGTNSEVDFRALSFDHPGGAATSVAGLYLYLSWYIKVHPTIAPGYENSFVDVGFRPTSGTAVRFRIRLAAAVNSGTAVNGDGGTFAAGDFTVDFFSHTGGSTWALQAPGSEPSWIASETRVWAKPPGGTPWWAVHMRVPVTGGLDLTGKFGLGFYIEADSTSFVIDHRWPSALPPLETTDPNPASFENCFLEDGSGLTGSDTERRTGVSLAYYDIGTQGVTAIINGVPKSSPDVITFTAGSTNTFFAKPKNEDPSTAVAANAITARFVLGNFGSMPPGGPWKTLGSGTTHPAIAANGGQQDITFVWTPSTTDQTFYTGRPHQCILVDLSSADTSLTFLNASAARNMDFGSASRFQREVQISVEGLADGYAHPNRDVYIYVERINVPATMDRETRAKYQEAQKVLRAVTSVDGHFSPEQRYVSIVQGDLRQLRLIDLDPFVEWLRSSFRREELVVRGALFELLKPYGVQSKDFMDLLDRYADQVRNVVRGLRYDDNGQPQLTARQREIANLLPANSTYRGEVPPAVHPLPPSEELERYLPTVKYHVYHDTGRISTRNGVNRPVLELQPSFGYHLWLDHDVQSWELRLQGAEKLAEDLYLLRPPTEGSTKLNTVIHAVQQGEEKQIDPPEKIVPFPKYPRQDAKGGRGGCLSVLGPIGRGLAKSK